MTPRWEDAELLRVYLGSRDQVRGQPAHEWLLQAARELGLPGATVTEGSVGYGRDGVIVRAGLLRLHPDLPLLAELVAGAGQISAFLEAALPQLPADVVMTRHTVRRLVRP